MQRRLQPHASLAPAAPQLRVTLNGGLEGLPALRAAAATPGLDGLMCGRCAPGSGSGSGSG